MSEAAAPALWQLDDLRIDLARQRVERDGVALNVSGLSFQLLRYLIAQGDRVVGFDELIAQVWSPAVVNEETVTQRVKLLRQALGDDGRQPRYLRSVRGQGYQLCVAPQPLIEAPAAAVAHAPAIAERVPLLRRKVLLGAVAGALAALTILAVMAWSWRQHTATRPASMPAVSATSELLQRAKYYAAIGQRDDNERAIALYERVLAESPHQVDAQLGLSRALSARVCLFNFPPEWAQRAQGLAEQVIARQPRLAAAYAALGYSHDCRGRIDAALIGYETAMRLDPADDNSRASAGYLYERKGRLADALIANTSLRGDPKRVRFLPLQLASNLELLGYPQAAEARYRRSFELYPDNVFSNIAWPRFLIRQNRLSQAQAALEEALQRGTDHVDLHVLSAELALLRGDRQAARAACAEAVALRPQASYPATLAALLSDKPDVARLRERAQAMSQELDTGAGYPADWLEVALMREATGERALALAAVQRAVDAGYRDTATLQGSPWFAGMRDDPAFARALDTIQNALVKERARVPPAVIRQLLSDAATGRDGVAR